MSATTAISTKFEYRNPKQIRISNVETQHTASVYDLEERTFLFAQRTRRFVRSVPRTVSNVEDGKQVVRSSGSVGANYIEANECLSKKDFLLRIKVCRKEAKESRYWLRLFDLDAIPGLEPERQALIREGTELMNIMGAIMRKSEK